METYKIVRGYFDELKDKVAIETDLTLEEAENAFGIRAGDDPFQPSGMPGFEFPPQGLGDILADALDRRNES